MLHHLYFFKENHRLTLHCHYFLRRFVAGRLITITFQSNSAHLCIVCNYPPQPGANQCFCFLSAGANILQIRNPLSASSLRKINIFHTAVTISLAAIISKNIGVEIIFTLHNRASLSGTAFHCRVTH
jgi:hypothetical protein